MVQFTSCNPWWFISALLPKHLCEKVLINFNSLEEAGTSLGTAGGIIINKQMDIIDAIFRLAKFYKHESCGHGSYIGEI